MRTCGIAANNENRTKKIKPTVKCSVANNKRKIQQFIYLKNFICDTSLKKF